MAHAQLSPRNIPDRLEGRGARLLKSWEALLIVVATVIFLGNSFASPYFLDPWNLSDATFNFTEKAMIAFAMALVIISGEIDLSVASIIALASTAMGYAVQLGVDTPVLVAIGLGVGLVCGAVNGLLITGLGLPSIVVTIGTMSLFRGLSFIILGDQAFTGYPESFAWFGQGYVWWVFSFEFTFFVLLAVAYGVLLHKTNFGRAVYAIGNNQTAALFSGVRVARVKFTLFLLTGLMAGLASICLTSRLGSTRPSIALGCGARGRHHGGARRRQHSWRLGHDTGCRAGGADHGHGHLWLRPPERAGYRHVDLHRPVADLGHRASDPVAARPPPSRALRSPDGKIRFPNAAQPGHGRGIQSAS
ncbi:ribose/xylose/arabinose/galactoside ABC-type transport system permease subunit [Sinorhizobium fredii]